MAAESRWHTCAQPTNMGHGIILQRPLSRCGRGPGLILIVPASLADCEATNSSLDPRPLQKWAEEGYTVMQITLDAESSADEDNVCRKVKSVTDILSALNECSRNDHFGLLVYGSQLDYTPSFTTTLQRITQSGPIAAIVYHSFWETPSQSSIPSLIHLPDSNNPPQPPTPQTIMYTYPDAISPGFIVPGHENFKYITAGVAHTRTLTFLKHQLKGPYFDLEKIWAEHTRHEFEDRSVEKTMATMVDEPYVNHIPTMTGGIGRARLSNFYLNHFIFKNPDDTALELISRTVGVDRIVDEFIFSFTHDKEVDWLHNSRNPPTHKTLQIPFTSVVNIRGDRLYHEHIAWDQATVLTQLGLLPQWLPFPYALPGEKLPARGKRFEYRVPAAGAETADKLRDGGAVESNKMLALGEGGAVREVDDI
ncbi:hypothetical protein BO70DRAFT_331598 [Aspergillus heteromorphus CBS 117.55]|uniref:Carboxymethylenebutenolidase n=1 Tax=Aspergillus heteromorphus CBS 117.55 TaxID=1448321 RepID=A0A317WQE8_9EURO|nr:uncharacterized protein BO70DRAFT_331598 [Aspergillus heteromorphus CBS 117.55]PWY88285.1 hypothetical protein BO70DRAFT_331598 [Aspergillus heteromorphus CBS 117.55]